jgi:hypothetical protein
MIISRIYETQILLLLWLVSFLVGLRSYQHPCSSTNADMSLAFLIVTVDLVCMRNARVYQTNTTHLIVRGTLTHGMNYVITSKVFCLSVCRT